MPTIINRINAAGHPEQLVAGDASIAVRQLPQRDSGGAPVEETRTRAMSEIGPTTYHEGRTIFPTDQPAALPAAEPVQADTQVPQDDAPAPAAPSTEATAPTDAPVQAKRGGKSKSSKKK